MLINQNSLFSTYHFASLCWTSRSGGRGGGGGGGHTDRHVHIVAYAFRHTHVLAEYTFFCWYISLSQVDNYSGLSDSLFKFHGHA